MGHFWRAAKSGKPQAAGYHGEALQLHAGFAKPGEVDVALVALDGEVAVPHQRVGVAVGDRDAAVDF